MQLDDLERDGGKPKQKKTCDPRLPCHYGGGQVETKIAYGNNMPTPSSEYQGNRRWNPDNHLGGVESETPEQARIGFRVPSHFDRFNP